MNTLSVDTEPYKRFRSWVALQRISFDYSDEKVWKFYDYGPKDVIPLVLLPGVSGTAEIYFKQFLSLCPKGYRLISVQFPAFASHDDWCKGFERFLDKQNLKKIHLFGTSIGGYLAQCFIQQRPQRVQSLILCNSFSDTSYYKENAPCAAGFPFMPEFLLKRMILSNFPTKIMEEEIAASVDFMVTQLETIPQKELAYRLVLNCTVTNLRPPEWTFDRSKVTILDCVDEVSVPEKLREEVYKYFPEAKIAELKTGGNFPYLSRPYEVNMHIQVHLRKYATEGQQNPEEIEESSSTLKNPGKVEEKKEESKAIPSTQTKEIQSTQTKEIQSTETKEEKEKTTTSEPLSS